MKITQEGQTVTVEINEVDTVNFYERFQEGSKTVIGANGSIQGNAFRYDGTHVKKYGAGKFKKEKEFFQQLENVEVFLKESGFKLTN